ncbi:copper-binding protein [Candidatus Woesearchaeota archaeon]|nr:MAG: copper-binding protein [Candidatus Woesearchaeota archaeon]
MKKAAILLALLFLASCAEELPPSPPAPGETTPVQTGQLTEVTIEGFAFNPPVVTIRAGESVRFKNLDRVTHTATGDSFDTGPLASGESKEITFDTPGTYDYICTPHPNMKGKIVVQ